MLILDDNCAIRVEDITCIEASKGLLNEKIILIYTREGNPITIQDTGERLYDIMQYIRAWNTKKNHPA